jgi:hypothetical protein
MDYLLATLAWYVVAAFVIGFTVGWVTCGKLDDERA